MNSKARGNFPKRLRFCRRSFRWVTPCRVCVRSSRKQPSAHDALTEYGNTDPPNGSSQCRRAFCYNSMLLADFTGRSAG